MKLFYSNHSLTSWAFDTRSVVTFWVTYQFSWACCDSHWCYLANISSCSLSGLKIMTPCGWVGSCKPFKLVHCGWEWFMWYHFHAEPFTSARCYGALSFPLYSDSQCSRSQPWSLRGCDEQNPLITMHVQQREKETFWVWSLWAFGAVCYFSIM